MRYQEQAPNTNDYLLCKVDQHFIRLHSLQMTNLSIRKHRLKVTAWQG